LTFAGRDALDAPCAIALRDKQRTEGVAPYIAILVPKTRAANGRPYLRQCTKFGMMVGQQLGETDIYG